MRASVDSAGAQADDRSQFPSISLDGRFVAFESRAANLVIDANHSEDVFVRDLLGGTTFRASVASSGMEGDSPSRQPDISGDGRFIAWQSNATNLVLGDTNASTDIFIHDRVTGTTARVSVASGGAQASQDSIDCDLSANGRFVAFESDAPDLVAADTNNDTDVFIHDRQMGVTERLSVASSGSQADSGSFNASVSGDGRFVAFESLATNLVASDSNGFTDVFVRDRAQATTVRVSVAPAGSQGNGSSVVPAISTNGRFIAFTSFASNLIAGDTNGWEDIFLHDRLPGTTVRMSLSVAAVQGNDSSDDAALSEDGRFTAFTSLASNLVGGDTNSTWDIFVRDEGTQLPGVYCTAKTNSLGCVPQISWAGTASASNASAFVVTAQDLVNQRNGLLFYGFAPTSLAYQGGTLCVAAPTRRTPIQNSGGSVSPPDCSGTLAFDFNSHIQSGVDPQLVAGESVYAQYWSRDPSTVSNTNLTDAIQFTIGP